MADGVSWIRAALVLGESDRMHLAISSVSCPNNLASFYRFGSPVRVPRTDTKYACVRSLPWQGSRTALFSVVLPGGTLTATSPRTGLHLTLRLHTLWSSSAGIA